MTTLLGNHGQFANSQQAIFNPTELFGGGEQGLWLDPSDMTATKAGWRRNLLTYSEQFGVNTGGWSKQGLTVTDNTDVDPNGQTTADTLLTTVGVSNPGVFQNVNLVAGQQYTFSVWLKAGTISSTKINCWGPGVGVFSAVDVSLTSNWQRFTHTFTSPVTGTGLYSISPEGFIVGTGKTVIVWGAQLELGSSASTYQPITDFSTEFKAAFPTHALYQDSNGVTPCTDSGQPVGLILDQSRGGLGAKTEIALTNGSFDSGLTGWNASNATTNTGTSGQVTITSTSGSAYGFIGGTGANAIVTSDTRWYELVVDCELVSGTGFFGAFTTGGVYSLFTDTGRKTRKMIISGSSLEPRVGVTNAIGTSIIVYDVKLYQIPGNHAYQTTSASRPTLARIPSSGRRNLLTRTEEFDNAAWTLTQATISANATTAPDNTSTADKLISSAATAARSIRSTSTFSAGTLVCSVYVKAAEYSKFGFREGNTTGAYATFNLATGAVVSQGDGGTGSITSIGNGWYRCSCAFTSAGSVRLDFHPLPDSYTSGRPDISFAGDGTSGVFLWGAQLETGSTATNYQKVVATTDVTESGVGDLWHLVFDGSDDSLVTNSVDFTATDEMTVIAGVRKLSDAARGTVCELTATIASNNGAFHLTAPNAASATYAFESKGTLLTDGVASSVTAPLTSVISGSADISADTNVIRVNGTQSDSDTGDQGTGNYSNAAIYIGRRGGTTLPFNGHLYQLIIRGKTTSGSKLLEAERFAGKKTGVSF